MNTYPRVDLTYHGDGNVGIGTPSDASAPRVMGEPVERLRVSLTDGVGSTQEKGRNWTPIFTLQDVQDAILAERMEILKLLREQAEFWKEWEYPEEYIFAVGVLTERIKCKPTSK